jgi:acyl carrier protein
MQVRDRDSVRQQLGLESVSHSVAPVESALAGRLAEWEQRKRSGGQITAAEISGVLRSDQVGLLSDATAGRLHALLRVSPNGNGRVHLETSETPATPASTPELAGDLISTVKRCLAELLELDEVEDSKPFQEYGMDSISGLRFSMFLEKKLKFPVSPQWLMEHPTPRALADHLAAARDNSGEMKERGVT